jgi:hypothetical protein
MESLLLLLLGSGLILVFLSGDWRIALFYTLFVGFAQDPLRKMTPGQPQYMVGLVVIAAAVTLISLFTSRGKIPFKLAFSKDTALLQYFPIFLWVILISALNSLLRSGSVEVPLIGLFVYSSPLLALWLGFHFSTRPGSVAKLLLFYIAIVSVFAFTILLSFWGVASPLFKEVGEGNLIFLDIGIGITGHSGLWRTSEIAAWHLGAASCFAIMLAVRTKKFLPIVGSLFFTLALMWISILTGRRKVLTLVAGFLILFTILIITNSRRLTRETFLSAVGLIGFSVGIFVLSGGLDELQSGVYGSFFRRGSTVFGDVSERFQGNGITGSFVALQDAGLFGLGIGTTYQNAVSRLGIDVAKSQLSWGSEGGIGKIAYDIGIVGVVFFAVMIFLLVRLFLRLVRDRDTINLPDHFLMLGMLAFLAANLPTFAAQGQLFNDFFVLLMLGLSCGFILGLGVLNASVVNALPPSSQFTANSPVHQLP